MLLEAIADSATLSTQTGNGPATVSEVDTTYISGGCEPSKTPNSTRQELAPSRRSSSSRCMATTKLGAAAIALSNQGLLDQFVVSDRALAAVAGIEGLTVLNPEALH